MAANVNREANLRGGYGRQRSFLGTRRAWSASLTAPSGAGNLAWYPARLRRRPQPPRGLGNLQRRVFSLPRPRKRSAACFGAFRRVGNVQRRVLMLSEASETFSGVFWSFPRPRKRSAACFDVFRGLGRGANMRRRAFPAHPAYLCRRLSGIWMRCELSDTMSDYYLLLRDYSNYYL